MDPISPFSKRRKSSRCSVSRVSLACSTCSGQSRKPIKPARSTMLFDVCATAVSYTNNTSSSELVSKSSLRIGFGFGIGIRFGISQTKSGSRFVAKLLESQPTSTSSQSGDSEILAVSLWLFILLFLFLLRVLICLVNMLIRFGWFRQVASQLQQYHTTPTVQLSVCLSVCVSF